ncbi:MAG: hypothetical protein K0B14_20120 [Anaerolineaceae bacterium]|nr:hypothetical protein [Anaerolineaceae bacterium]
MFNTKEMNQRLSRKISVFEFASLLIVLLIALYFLITKSGMYFDYEIYLGTAQGDFSNYFYGYWLVPFFKILAFLPFDISYFIWIVLSIIGVFFASRVFNGNSYLALFSYQM